MVDGRDNAWRSRAPGPHTHGNAVRQVMDGLRTEVCGQQKQSNDPATTRTTLVGSAATLLDAWQSVQAQKTAGCHECHMAENNY